MWEREGGFLTCMPTHSVNSVIWTKLWKMTISSLSNNEKIEKVREIKNWSVKFVKHFSVYVIIYFYIYKLFPLFPPALLLIKFIIRLICDQNSAISTCCLYNWLWPYCDPRKYYKRIFWDFTGRQVTASVAFSFSSAYDYSSLNNIWMIYTRTVTWKRKELVVGHIVTIFEFVW